MNVAQLIEELSKFPPHHLVRVCPQEVFDGHDGMMNLSPPDDATEAQFVSPQGGWVLIEGR